MPNNNNQSVSKTDNTFFHIIEKYTAVITLAISLLLLILMLLKNAEFFHDDAFITLRYAVNLAETGLPQWNPGEWVEGYTSVLHMALLAGMIQLNFEPMKAAQIFNLAAAIGIIIMTLIAASKIGKNSLYKLVAVSTVALTPSLATWVMGGLEAVVVSFWLVTGLVLLLVQQSIPSFKYSLLLLTAIFFSFALLTRLDASIFVAGTGIGLILFGKGSFRNRFLIATFVVGVPAAVSLFQMGVRFQVYGELFPLTFYAKTDLPVFQRVINGLFYIVISLVQLPVILIAIMLSLRVFISKRISRYVGMLSMPVFLHLCYLIWAGGDHMPSARMLVPILAPASLLLLALVSEMRPNRALLTLGISAGLTLLLAIIIPLRPMDPAAYVGGIVGRYIDESWPRDITVALNTAGSTPYFASKDRVFIDMLGLNDTVIAKRQNVPHLTSRQSWPGHSKGDGAYVLSRKPDRIIVGPAEGVTTENAWFLTGAELNSIPEFHRCYQKVLEQIDYPVEDTLLKKHLQKTRNSETLEFTYYKRVCSSS